MSGRRALARALTAPAQQRTALTGQVVSVDTSQKQVTVSPYQDAAAADHLTMPHLAHYTPATGDTVLLVWVGGNALIAIGKLP